MEQGIALIPNEVVSLIARLEAAEKCMSWGHQPYCHVKEVGICGCGYNAWRKSKGDGE